MSRIAQAVLTLLLLSGLAVAGDRKLAAEGDYGLQGTGGYKAWAHWKLWHLRDGEYEVEEVDASNRGTVQVFTFDRNFLPTGFSLTINPYSKTPPPRSPGYTFHLTAVSCRYLTTELKCETDINGKKSAISVPTSQPYVFVPGGFEALDWTWFMTGVTQLSRQKRERSKSVNVLLMYNIMTSEVTGPEGAINLSNAGEVTANMAWEKRSVIQYEGLIGGEDRIWGPGNCVVQVTPSGFVVGLNKRSIPGGPGFTISNYKNYESWPLDH